MQPPIVVLRYSWVRYSVKPVLTLECSEEEHFFANVCSYIVECDKSHADVEATGETALATLYSCTDLHFGKAQT